MKSCDATRHRALAATIAKAITIAETQQINDEVARTIDFALARAIDQARTLNLDHVHSALHHARARALNCDFGPVFIRNLKMIGIDVRRKVSIESNIGQLSQILALRLLAWIGRRCSKPTQEIVEIIVADLNDEAIKMQRHKYSEKDVKRVILRKVITGTVLPITWDTIRRGANALLNLGKIKGP